MGNIAAINENKIILSILYHGNKLINDKDKIFFTFVTCISVLTKDDKIKLIAPPIIP